MISTIEQIGYTHKFPNLQDNTGMNQVRHELINSLEIFNYELKCKDEESQNNILQLFYLW